MLNAQPPPNFPDIVFHSANINFITAPQFPGEELYNAFAHIVDIGALDIITFRIRSEPPSFLCLLLPGCLPLVAKVIRGFLWRD